MTALLWQSIHSCLAAYTDLNDVRRTLQAEEAQLPLEVLAHVRTAVMVTTAAIDRLVHHCVIVKLNVPSYRVEQAKEELSDSIGERTTSG